MDYQFIYLCAMLLVSTVTITRAVERNPKKRQIYREQVLPHAGGKVPDTAFETDRLFLNRLQKEGIAVPDGVVTEQRNPQVYQYYDRSPRLVYRIALSSDGRYKPVEGRYSHRNTPTIETTYLYPQIHGRVNDVYHTSNTIFPKYRQLELPNTQLNQVRLQSKKKVEYLDITPTFNKRPRSNAFKPQSYQNFNMINTPISSTLLRDTNGGRGRGSGNKINYYAPKVNGAAELFHDFDDIFNNFNLYEKSGSIYDDGALISMKHSII